MRIQSSEKIASIPILEVRRLLRGVGEYWTVESVIEILGIPRRKATALTDELSRREFVERVKLGSKFYWRSTLAGNALALATAARAIRRGTANRVFAAFLDRVAEVNPVVAKVWPASIFKQPVQEHACNATAHLERLGWH
jgi:hypothetical protein